MTLRAYLAIMSFTTLICWSIFAFVVRSVNPDITNLFGFILFYASFFLALSGTAALVGFLFRFVGLKKELVFYSVKSAFRQSFLFAFLIISVLYLLSKNLFTWLNLFILIFGITVLEYILLTATTQKKYLIEGHNYENTDNKDDNIEKNEE